MSVKDISLMAHLMRRAGFGAPLEELEARAAKGYEVTVEELLHPEEQPLRGHLEAGLDGTIGPGSAATDDMKNYADQVRQYVGRQYTVLGTEGFGRSDTRERLRHFFEVDRYFITVAALDALVKENILDATVVKTAIEKVKSEPDKSEPRTAGP